MNCQKCGNPIKEGSQFCTNCGAPVTAAPTGGMNDQTGATPFPMPNNNPEPMPTPQPAPAPTPEPAPMNSTPSYPSMNNTSSNNNVVLYAIIGILVIALIGVSVFFIFFKKDNSSSNSNSNNGGTVAQSTISVNYSGFTFNVPTDLSYALKNNELLIGDTANTWISEIIFVDEGNYSQLEAIMSNLPAAFQSRGGSAKNVQEKSYSGKKYVTFDLTLQGLNYVAAYTENTGKILGVTIRNAANDFDYSLMDTITPIVNSAKYGQTSNSIEINSDIANTIIEVIK